MKGEIRGVHELGMFMDHVEKRMEFRNSTVWYQLDKINHERTALQDRHFHHVEGFGEINR